ncbi:hypothetical protein CXB51_009961 [Gossypium anomalum]|uniref:DUF7745 domain-containing protein n=1 Tax=Gossypium anomalum TaxID=47600 RepID=A0A8J5Z202_9ROSI|nr:hypothetical protein CXB51_009961 [Gossypium anomalum]
MRNEYLDKVEDNASVCTWSKKTHLEKGDSVTERYTSELWDFTRINSTQNDFQELRGIWAQWDDEAKQLFYQNYGDLPHLLDIKVDKRLFQAMVQFWNPTYSCFTFREVDLVPTLEEYMTLLHCPKIQGNKAYVRPANLPTFVKKLMMITGMSEQWAAARIQQKGDGKCIPWASLGYLILAHPDLKRRVDVLALSIYGLVIFPKVMGHIDEAVADLVDRLGKQNTPVPAILAETFRSLNACQRVEEDRFIGCAQLLLVWFHSHFWKVDKVPCRVFFKDYSPLKEAAATPRRDDVTEKRVVGYTPLLVLRQYKAEQFIPVTQGLAQSDFSYKGDHYKKKMREIFEAWKKTEFGGCSIDGGEFTSDSIRVRGHKKIEVEKVRKEKRKIEKDQDDLKIQYKKTQLSLKRAGLGKSSEQWQQEVQEERAKGEYWEKKFQEMQAQNQVLEKENQGLTAKVIELGRSLHYHRSRNSAVELKASLNKIEEMKHNIGRLETALQNYKLRIEQLKAREGHWKEELHHLQDQVGDTDYLMGEAIVQIREVADHLQDLAAQANILSTKYELVTDRGLELASLLDKIKTLGLRAKAYL